jgi:hypothetical protein
VLDAAAIHCRGRSARRASDSEPHLHRIIIGTRDDIATEISRSRRENPKNKRGANDYALAQFGLDG